MVLVILAIVWVAVLLPPAVRARADRRPADSISAFRRQLTTLRRTRPGAPRGSRLRTRGGGDAVLAFPPSRSSRGPVGPTGPARRPRPAAPAGRALRSVGGPAAPRRAASGPVPRPSSRTIKRRRDIFVALVTASLATLALGLAVPALQVMLVVHLLVDGLLAAYIALLIRQRNVLAERDMKVRFLPGPRPVEPALLRRSVN